MSSQIHLVVEREDVRRDQSLCSMCRVPLPVLQCICVIHAFVCYRITSGMHSSCDIYSPKTF